MNDAHPRWRHAEGGQEHAQDPYAQDPYAQGGPYSQGDPYSQQDSDYGYDPYAGQQYPQYQQQPPQPSQPPQQPYYGDPAQTYAGRQPYGYRQQGQGQQGQGQQSQQGQGQGYIPQQQAYQGQQYAQPQQYQDPRYQQPQQPQQYQNPGSYGGEPPYGQQPPAPEPKPAAADYHTEQFSFVDEADEESQEVIDWLKFSESRTERRDERKRRGRNRIVALVAVVVLAAVGGVGYLWQAGKIPGLGGSSSQSTQSTVGQKRDVIVLHLRPVDGSSSSTALLVSNGTTHKGTTVLLPNSLAVGSEDGGTTTLDKSVEAGAGPTRDALNALLGSDIKGTWRLDTPYLELLVESLGGIITDTDADVPASKKDSGKVLVKAGKQQELNGQAAVAYATYRGPGDAPAKQLTRFGQVVQAVLKKMPSDASMATKTIQALNAIPDPSLPDKELGASLAQLAEQAKTGAYDTTLLPVQSNGTLSQQATDSVVKDVLGGTVKNTGGSSPARVLVRDASGSKKAAGLAQAAVVNGGTYTYVPGGTASSTQGTSEVVYADDARKAAAEDVAKTLGLPATAVRKGTVPANADISVILGRDYKG